MKISKSLIAIAITTTLLISCKKQENKVVAKANEPKTISADAKMATTSFNIQGMTCAVGCAKTIEKELSETSGVKTATVDFDKKTAKVEYDSNAQTPEKLVELVEKTGDGKTYKVSNVVNSQDKAMLYFQDDQKVKDKKAKNKKTNKTPTYTANTTSETVVVETTKPSGSKPACCAAKKHCSPDEKSM